MGETLLAEKSDARYRAMADPVRRRLLRVLEDSTAPQDVETLAGAVGLHPNTVRGHLDVLEHAELVSRVREDRRRPGRPRTLYRIALGSAHPRAGGYRLLAEMLTNALQSATRDPAKAAEEAGREWGRYLVERPPPMRPLDAGEALGRIVAMLEDLGFDPDAAAEEERTVLRLRDCPFRDLARDHAAVVCSLHRGLLAGAAEALGGGTLVESLQPFVEPALCKAVLRPA